MSNRKPSLKKTLVFICLLTAIATSCEKESTPLKLPTINSSKIFSLSSNAVTIKSTFDLTKEDSVTNMGVCWGLQPNPTIYNNFTTSSYMNDSIVYTRIEGLTPNTKYYARVYVRNSEMETYGNEIEFTTNNTVVDVDGNLYNIVTIGSQNWMVENLKTTKYNDGAEIPLVNSNTNWSGFNSSGYSWYDNSIENKNLYGALYNWPVVNSEKLCPVGWHIPTDIEWTTLADYLGGEYEAGGFMKSTSSQWDTPNYKATNYAGFCGLPAGGSAATLGSFTGKGSFTVWWSSTIDYSIDSNEGWIMTRTLWYVNANLKRDGFMTSGGVLSFLSVRCIKD